MKKPCCFLGWLISWFWVLFICLFVFVVILFICFLFLCLLVSHKQQRSWEKVSCRKMSFFSTGCLPMCKIFITKTPWYQPTLYLRFQDLAIWHALTRVFFIPRSAKQNKWDFLEKCLNSCWYRFAVETVQALPAVASHPCQECLLRCRWYEQSLCCCVPPTFKHSQRCSSFESCY